MAIAATIPPFSVITDDTMNDWFTEVDAAVSALQGAGVGGTPVDVTTSTLTVTAAAHSGRTVTLSRAAGIAVTLPAATGTGNKYRFVVKTTVTSNTSTIKGVGDDTMTGVALMAADGGATLVAWETASDSDTITFDGTTTGGVKGDVVELEDIAADLWHVSIVGSSTGTEATPFSATVS